MKIIDELYQSVSFHSLTELFDIIERIREKKVKEMDEVKKKISDYEQKKRAEEAFYQSLSPVRKFFTGRPTDQHQAVEYMVHVKERLKRIERIKRQVRELDEVVFRLKETPSKDEVILSTGIIEEIKFFKEQGGVEYDYSSS